MFTSPRSLTQRSVICVCFCSRRMLSYKTLFISHVTMYVLTVGCLRIEFFLPFPGNSGGYWHPLWRTRQDLAGSEGWGVQSITVVISQVTCLISVQRISFIPDRSSTDWLILILCWFLLTEEHLRKAAPHPLSHVSLVSAPEMSMGINSTANAVVVAVASAVERENTRVRGKSNTNTDLNNIKSILTNNQNLIYPSVHHS